MKRNVELKEKHMLKIMYSLFCSLCFLHKCNVMHRDLKCANILVTANCQVKICDFGLSRSIPQSVMDDRIKYPFKAKCIKKLKSNLICFDIAKTFVLSILIEFHSHLFKIVSSSSLFDELSFNN